jgi:ribosomal 50S subunit-recycling heat shock protein
MRIDLCLSHFCLFKTRSQAGKACDEGRVFLNAEPARASRVVHTGDRIRFIDRLGRFEEEVEVLEVPEKQVSRPRARELYRTLYRRAVEFPGGAGPSSDDFRGEWS